MITLRTALITACAIAALSALPIPDDAPAPDRAGRVSDTPAARVEAPSRDGTQSLAAGREEEWTEPEDTTGLLRERVDIDELVDELNADSGDGFEPVDREALASLLLGDPALRRHFVRTP